MTWDPWTAMRAVRELDVPAPQRVVLYALVTRADATGEAWPSMATLASDTGQHEQTCRRAIEALVAAGHLVRTGGKGRTYRYRLSFHPVQRVANPVQRVTPYSVHDRAESTTTPCREHDPPRAESTTTPCREHDDLPNIYPTELPKELPKKARATAEVVKAEVMSDVERLWANAERLRGEALEAARPCKLTRKLRGHIRQRLGEYSLDELEAAQGVLFAAGSWWVQNGQTRHELWCRSHEQVAKLLARTEKPRQPALAGGLMRAGDLAAMLRDSARRAHEPN